MVRSNILIANMLAEYWPEVARIYEEGIRTKNATFEQSCPNWQTWNQNHRDDCRLVAKDGDKIIGWAALSNISERCVYAGVCEVSVYVDSAFQGQGVGQLLMQSLVKESEKNNIWTLQAGIFPENKASISLHLKQGFRNIGIREKLGQIDNQWRDVLLLERRSKKVGV